MNKHIETSVHKLSFKKRLVVLFTGKITTSTVALTTDPITIVTNVFPGEKTADKCERELIGFKVVSQSISNTDLPKAGNENQTV